MAKTILRGSGNDSQRDVRSKYKGLHTNMCASGSLTVHRKCNDNSCYFCLNQL